MVSETRQPDLANLHCRNGNVAAVAKQPHRLRRALNIQQAQTAELPHLLMPGSWARGSPAAPEWEAFALLAAPR